MNARISASSSSSSSSANLRQTILAALEAAGFVYADAFASALALAIASGKNLLLWGPAGHGKSEMTSVGLGRVAAASADVFVQSFGEGMDEATLWGGLDFTALETEKVLRYHPERSFLNAEWAVFEELFDAPTSVLLALKDTLTAKELRKGAQRFPMKTRVVVGLTNKDPEDISDMGPAAHALIERFPLQLRVEWEKYEAGDYLRLLEAVPGAKIGDMTPVLAQLLAKAGAEGGRPVSPRTAVHAAGVVRAQAAMNGHGSPRKEDLLALRFVDGLGSLAAGVEEEIAAAAERAAAEGVVSRWIQEVNGLLAAGKEAQNSGSPIKLLQASKRLIQATEATFKSLPDDLKARVGAARAEAQKQAVRLQELAISETKI
jgi:hypothetical protein